MEITRRPTAVILSTQAAACRTKETFVTRCGGRLRAARRCQGPGVRHGEAREEIDESALDVDPKHDNRKNKDRGHWCRWHP